MKKIFLSIITLALALTVSSCEKALDLKPDSQITTSSFWQSPDDFEAALVGCYDGVQNALTGSDNDNLWLWGEGRADGVTARDQVGLAVNAVTADGLYGVNWRLIYRAINNLNLLQKNLRTTTVPVTVANRNRIKADAFFLRGLMYSYLGRVWGNAPVVTEGYDSYDQNMTPGNGAANQTDLVFEQARADADSAIRLYRLPQFTNPGSPAGSFTNKGRGSLAAALALRADLSIWQAWRKNDNALFTQTVADVDSALKNTTLYNPTLSESYRVIFGANNPREDVFVIKYSDITEVNRMFVRATVSGVSYTTLRNPYAQTNNLFVPNYGSLQYIVSQKLANKYRTGDVRRDENMVQFFPPVVVPGLQDWYPRKYRGNASTTNFGVTQTTDNVRIFRAADLLLLKAEALAKLNRPTEAITIVNNVRRRAFETAYNAANHGVRGTPTGEALVDTVLDERFRELMYEGKRWFDLVRTKRALTELRDPLPSAPAQPRRIATNDNELLWPISAGSTNLNPNLKQNAGY